MKLIQQSEMKNIISENHIIKFFDKEEYAQKFLFNGEMLFNTLEHFAQYGQAGRGDPSEIVFKISGTLCYQDPHDGLYCKLIDFKNINRDKKRLIYCYYDLRKINFIQNNKKCVLTWTSLNISVQIIFHFMELSWIEINSKIKLLNILGNTI